uniref:Uncharacterized protein n=1 Tax=Arundo donax TaxID=35708 RepID=A0A0A9EH03_ARUDO
MKESEAYHSSGWSAQCSVCKCKTCWFFLLLLVIITRCSNSCPLLMCRVSLATNPWVD